MKITYMYSGVLLTAHVLIYSTYTVGIFQSHVNAITSLKMHKKNCMYHT